MSVPSIPTWIAIVATMLGVGIIVADGFGSGNLLGDFYALVCAVLLAVSLTLARKSGKDLSPGARLWWFGVCCVCATDDHLGWHHAVGADLVDPRCRSANPTGGVSRCGWPPRFIPAPQVALFYLLETVLATALGLVRVCRSARTPMYLSAVRWSSQRFQAMPCGN